KRKLRRHGLEALRHQPRQGDHAADARMGAERAQEIAIIEGDATVAAEGIGDEAQGAQRLVGAMDYMGPISQPAWPAGCHASTFRPFVHRDGEARLAPCEERGWQCTGRHARRIDLAGRRRGRKQRRDRAKSRLSTNGTRISTECAIPAQSASRRSWLRMYHESSR